MGAALTLTDLRGAPFLGVHAVLSGGSSGRTYQLYSRPLTATGIGTPTGAEVTAGGGGTGAVDVPFPAAGVRAVYAVGAETTGPFYGQATPAPSGNRSPCYVEDVLTLLRDRLIGAVPFDPAAVSVTPDPDFAPQEPLEQPWLSVSVAGFGRLEGDETAEGRSAPLVAADVAIGVWWGRSAAGLPGQYGRLLTDPGLGVVGTLRRVVAAVHDYEPVDYTTGDYALHNRALFAGVSRGVRKTRGQGLATGQVGSTRRLDVMITVAFRMRLA